MAKEVDIFICLVSVMLLAHCSPCDDEEKCSENLPFCTPVGCVFKCPDGVFVNGSNCVQDCGNRYIFNRTCVHSCPRDHELIEEQINFRFIKLRFCKSRCEPNTFAYNTSCIKACPIANKYIEDGLCTSNCSTMKPLHQNITSDNRIVGIECLETCNQTSNCPFQYINECVPKCRDRQVVSNGNCLQSCPTHSQILINIQMCLQLGACQNGWPEQQYCSKECPESSYIHDNGCVDRCAEAARLSLDGRCVNRCPDQKYTCHKHRFTQELGDTIECCTECPFPLRSNNYTSECVNVCPKDLKNFNRTCLIDCPNSTYIESVMETGEFTCVSNCQKYTQDNLCVGSCPTDAKYLHGSRCVTECPMSHPYTAKNPFRCLKECPGDLKTNSLGNECVARCPEGTFNFQKKCLSDCPVNTYKDTKEINCVDQCDKFEVNGRCVDSCRRFSVNTSCVEECPDSYKVVYGGICHRACPENTCVSQDGFNCTEKCMREMKHNKLVYKCPESAPYTRKNMSDIYCVSVCETNEVLNDVTCINVNECNRAVLSHGKCADECAEGYLYMPKSGSKLVVSVDGYQYTLEDAKENPCKTVFMVNLALVSVGLFLALFVGLFAAFLLPIPIDISICARYNHGQARHEEGCCRSINGHLNSDQHAIIAPNDDEEDDCPLLTEITDNAPLFDPTFIELTNRHGEEHQLQPVIGSLNQGIPNDDASLLSTTM